jgi:flagellar hook-associated protein 2
MATTSATTATNGTSANGSSFNFAGTISGLDTASIIQAMMSVEKAPLTSIATKRTALTSQQASWEQLRTLMSTFQTRVKQFTVWNQGGARMASSSNTNVLTATSGTNTAAGTYQLTINDLATSTVATSTTPLGRQLTAADLTSALTALPLAGTVSGGTTGFVVDGTIVHATISATGTLGDALEAMRSAIETQIKTTDAGASVAVTVTNNKVTFSITGAASNHAVQFGAGGDTSNAAAILGLGGVTSATFGTTSGTLSANNALGVIKTSTSLDSAGMGTAVPAASTGTLTINGASITYDTSKDTLASLITKINSSTAGVTASLDRANDHLVITSKNGGATAITLGDTGPLAAALGLNANSTTGQVLGKQASITVDGRTFTSDSNAITTAIDGVKIQALSKGTSTLTVAADATATTKAAQDIVDAYNAIADAIDTITNNAVNTTRGPLASNSTVRDLARTFRSMLTGFTASGALNSLADVGITSGAVGSKVGSTTRLQLDSTKLAGAIASDSSSVSSLFTNVMKPLDSALKTWVGFGGTIDTAEKDITNQQNALTKQESDVNTRVLVRQAALEAKFAKMESLLATMQTTTTTLNNTIAQQNKSTG